MNPDNKDTNIINSSVNQAEVIPGIVKSKFPDKFDISKIGKIDLAEAERIASEEVIFLTESDLIEGLEEFELVPVKSLKTGSDLKTLNLKDKPVVSLKEEVISQITEDPINNSVFSNTFEDTELTENITELIIPIEDIIEVVEKKIDDSRLDLIEKNKNVEIEPIVTNSSTSESIINIKESELINDIKSIESDIIDEKNEDFSNTKRSFTVTINEETLDAQLSSILNIEKLYKTDLKVLEKFNSTIIDTKCKFVDDQFLNKPIVDDSVSYNEDPLTERLVKMIEVADGKLELLESTDKDGGFLNYILEDYTLYNSEKFDNVFKEEVFYTDSDFEFIDNAIIRDDFTKYIHEIDDYFESEESLIQSEISEILGLIPDENNYIEDKLFGDYYKKYDLDNEIDFIKPEIDFFRSNYTGTKNLSYFTENENSISVAEKKSIEEDISSANAIVFEEDISEIEKILKNDYKIELTPIDTNEQKHDNIIFTEEITDITDKIIILEDKEKLFQLTSEFPDKHENLIRLLSYLDGLFEKLPEEVIRKFAESEYFELYSKVLKEMGV